MVALRYILLLVVMELVFHPATHANEKDSISAHSRKQTVEATITSTDSILNTCLNKINTFYEEMPIDEAKECALAGSKAGSIYFRDGKYNNALDLMIKSIKIAEAYDKDPQLLASLYLQSGNVYSIFEDYEKSLHYYDRGLEYTRQSNNIEQEALFLNNMTASYCYTKEVEKAKRYNAMAVSLPLKDSIAKYYYNSFNNGFIALAEDKLQAAIIAYKKSVTYAIHPGMSPKYLAASYSEISKIYEETNEPDSAILYLEKYKELTEKEGYSYMQIDCYKNLSRLYSKVNANEQAMFYQNKYVVYADSLMNTREFNRIRNKQFAYDKTKDTNYINELLTTVSTQQKILIGIILVLLTFIALLIKIYLQKQKLQKAYLDLFERNKEIVNAEQKYLEAAKTLSSLEKEKTVQPEESKSYGLKDEQRDELLKRINQIMETTTEFCNPDFSLAELSTLVVSNTKYVSQIINETYGINFRSFINDYRIKLSRKRLTDTENYGHYTIQAIAESVGFKSQSNFITSFRKTTGITPSLYQKMARQEEKQ